MSEPLLKQVQYLKNNGFTEQQANTLIYFYKDYSETTLATKKDIADVKKDIAQLRADTQKDIAQLRADTQKDIAHVRKDIEILRKDLMLRLGSIMAGGVTFLGFLIILLDFMK